MALDDDEDGCVFEYDLHLEVEPLVVGKPVLGLPREENSNYPGSYAGVVVEIVGLRLQDLSKGGNLNHGLWEACWLLH